MALTFRKLHPHFAAEVSRPLVRRQPAAVATAS